MSLSPPCCPLEKIWRHLYFFLFFFFFPHHKYLLPLSAAVGNKSGVSRFSALCLSTPCKRDHPCIRLPKRGCSFGIQPMNINSYLPRDITVKVLMRSQIA